MSQHDYNIANAGGAAVRSDMNNALTAIQSLNSGSTAPTATKPFMPWYDTATGALKMRNAGDTGWISMAEAVGGLSLRNRIINGGMQVAQRGTATLTAAYQFGSCDRWQFICSGGTSISGTIYQNTFNAYSTNYAGGVQAASWTNGQFFAQQRIEAKNCFDLNSKTVTVSARVYQDTGGTRSFDFILVKATGGVDNWTSQTTIAIVSAGSAATASPTLLSATFTLGASDCNNGIALLIRDNAANTVVSKSYQIGDVQLEVGPVATPFEQRPYGMELALCQRYYEKSYNIDIPPGTSTGLSGAGVEDVGGVGGAGYSSLLWKVKFSTSKRTTPTINTWDVIGTATAITTFTPTQNNGQGPTAVDAIGTSGFKVFMSQASLQRLLFNWSASAEL